MAVISLLDRAIPLEDPRFLVLLGLSGATLSLQGQIIRCQLLLAMLWQLRDHCSSKQADAQSAEGHANGEKPGSDSLKTLQRLNPVKRRNNRKWENDQRKVDRTHYCLLMVTKGVMCSPKKYWSLPLLTKFWRRDKMIHSVIDFGFIVCSAKGTFQ